MELVRHRVFSFAQESQRYCNYSANKHGNEITFIIPSWLTRVSCLTPTGYWDANSFYRMGKQPVIESALLGTLQSCEANYFSLLKCGWTPQQARAVLPNATKTEVVMTGFVSDWEHFFSLRTSIIAETGKPHPDASALADPLYKEFIRRGYMESLV